MCTKKFICTLIICFVLFFIQQAKAQSKGFVQDEVITVSGISSDNQIYGLSNTQKMTTRNYNDGFGRSIQIVAVQASPSQKDIIQPVVYDNLGRRTKSLLPYVGSDGSGSYRPNAISTEQPGFYTNGVTDKVADDSMPFTQQVFENSPLQRILKSGTVGAGFQPAGATGTQHYKTINYRSNNATKDGNIVMWGPDGSKQGNYTDNVLTVIDATDEDGVDALSFTDQNNRLVLKRQLTATAGQYLDTYYIYNNAGSISYVVPPKAFALMVANNNYTLNQTGVNKLTFQYVYDNIGRIVQKTLPGTGDIYLIYDPLNRPVLIQDARLRISNQWNYIKYDSNNHIISQGIYTDATNTTRALMQNYVSTGTIAANYNTTWCESRSSVSANGYYTNAVFPTTNISALAYSYYNDYDIDGNGTANYNYSIQSLTNESAPTTAAVKGVPTMVSIRTVGNGLSNIWLLKVMFYDKNGHLIQTQSNNQLNYTSGVITDYSTSAPDFTGTSKQTKLVKVTGTTAAPVTTSVLTTVAYDHMYRVKTIDQQYNAAAVLRVVSYTYNELGQVVDKQLHNVSGATYLQSVDYRYNIRGQLTSINNSKLNNDSGTTNTNDDTNDLFGMQVLYDQVDGNMGNTPWFNGKLSAVKWMSKDAAGLQSNERSYNYNYDALNRYTGSTYAERTVAATGAFSININGFNENSISYDAGGNLLTMKRNSSTIGGSSAIEFDNLAYIYDPASPNQLKTVTDGLGSNYTGYGFRNLSGTTTGSYAYDVNGNLTTDPYKSLTLDYNIVNRTDKITITSATGRYIYYTYNAVGQLIKKQQFDNSTLQNTTDYIDGFVYLNNVLSYFSTPEGRVRNTGTGSTVTLKPEYIISDQQGNTRVSFEESSTTPGTAVVRQENSYYGFGLVMPNSPVATPTTDNKQLYNGGSEWQKDFGNLPDYFQAFYRNYDASLGRFIGVDPKAESSDGLTVYQYAGNNPIMYNDPLGDIQQGGLGSTAGVGGMESLDDFSGGGGGGGSGGVQGGADLLDAARSGDLNALDVFGQLNGTSYFGSAAKAVYSALTGVYNIYSMRNGAIISTTQVYSSAYTDQYREVYASDPSTPAVFDQYVNLTQADASTLLGRNNGDNQREIDWAGATNAFFGMVGGIAEVAVGVLTSESGVGVFAIGDGGSRAILNGMRLYGYLSGHKNDSDVTPSNLGAVVGKVIDNDFGHVDVNKVGRFQTAFGMLNDAATMALTHTSWSSPAVDATSSIAGLFSDSYTIGYYYNYFVNPH